MLSKYHNFYLMLHVYLILHIWIHACFKQYFKNILMSISCCDVEGSPPILYVWMSGVCQYTYVYILYRHVHDCSGGCQLSAEQVNYSNYSLPFFTLESLVYVICAAAYMGQQWWNSQVLLEDYHCLYPLTLSNFVY